MNIKTCQLIISIVFFGYFNLNSEDFQKEKIAKPGEIVKQEEFKEQGIKKILFANNVILNIKKTDFDKDKIFFQINFGNGALSVPEGKEAMVHFAQPIYQNGGLTKTTDQELRNFLKDKQVTANFSVLENSFLIQCKTIPHDFEFNLQLCRAKLIDSAFPEEAFLGIKKSFDKPYNTLKTDMSEYFKNSVKRKISVNDNSLSLPEREVLDAITLMPRLIKEFE
jgi:zinc protease